MSSKCNFNVELNLTTLLGEDLSKCSEAVQSMVKLNAEATTNLDFLLDNYYSGDRDVVASLKGDYLKMTNTIVSLLRDELVEGTEDPDTLELLSIILLVYPATIYGISLKNTLGFYEKSVYRENLKCVDYYCPRVSSVYEETVNRLMHRIQTVLPDLGLVSWDTITLSTMAKSFNAHIRLYYGVRGKFELTGLLPPINPKSQIYSVTLPRRFLEPLLDTVNPQPIVENIVINPTIYCSELDAQLLCLYVYVGSMYREGTHNLTAPGLKDLTEEACNLLSTVELNPLSFYHLYGLPYKPFNKDVYKVIIKQHPQFFSEVYHD